MSLINVNDGSKYSKLILCKVSRRSKDGFVRYETFVLIFVLIAKKLDSIYFSVHRCFSVLLYESIEIDL